MPKTAEITVWAQDPYSDDIIPSSFDVFREPDLKKIKGITYLPTLTFLVIFIQVTSYELTRGL